MRTKTLLFSLAGCSLAIKDAAAFAPYRGKGPLSIKLLMSVCLYGIYAAFGGEDNHGGKSSLVYELVGPIDGIF